MTVEEKLRNRLKHMSQEEKLQLVSPCGYCCLSCPAYVEGICADEAVIQQTRRRAEIAGFSADELLQQCLGCRRAQGDPHGQGVCPTYDCCVNKKGLDFCYECEEFPCLKLAPIAEEAEVRTHNTKVYNLLMLRNLGLDGYITKSGKLRSQYARGKTPVVGDDVQIS